MRVTTTVRIDDRAAARPGGGTGRTTRRSRSSKPASASSHADVGGARCRSRAIGAVHRRARRAGGARADPAAPGLDFVPAFFGVLYAGAIAVPTYPPSGGARRPHERAAARHDRGRRRHARPLVSGRARTRGDCWSRSFRSCPGAVARRRRRGRRRGRGVARPPCRGASAMALLQYTSGSTATPRGVMVTHANLLHNLARSAAAGRPTARQRVGVVAAGEPRHGAHQRRAAAVLSGYPTDLMSPAAFLQRPARWLQAISRFGATHSGGPNFAYDLCARRVSDEDREGLDLRTWRVAYNGSEPVRRSTLEHFMRAFGQCGFRWKAFRPAYGLAESTLLVTSDPAGTPPVFDSPDPERAAGSNAGLQPRAPWSAPGSARRAHAIRIVDPVTLHRRADGEVGEIWVRASVASGTGTSRSRPRRPSARSSRYPTQRATVRSCAPAISAASATASVRHRPHQGRPHRPRREALPAGPRSDRGASASGRAAGLLRGVRRRARRRGTCGDGGRNRTALQSAAETAAADRTRSRPSARRRRRAPGLAPCRRARSGRQLPKTTSGKLQRFLCRDGFLEARSAQLPPGATT